MRWSRDDSVEGGSDFVTHGGQKDGPRFHCCFRVEFGFFQLDNEVVGRAEEVLDELKKNLTEKMLQDLPLLHGWL